MFRRVLLGSAVVAAVSGENEYVPLDQRFPKEGNQVLHEIVDGEQRGKVTAADDKARTATVQWESSTEGVEGSTEKVGTRSWSKKKNGVGLWEWYMPTLTY